ncbi:MAG: SPOR domain-containing protein [Pseudomonadota bacterium]
MLKLIFWSLLCINGALLAYQSGYLGKFKFAEREPARMQNQLGAASLTLIDAARAAAAVAPPPAPPAEPAPDAAASAAEEAAGEAPLVLVAAPVEPPKPVLACTEIGDFGLAESRRFDEKIGALGTKPTRRNVAVQEITNHIVYIPSPGGKEAAERKTAELQELGVTSYFIMPDGALKGAISLGVFKSETAAENLLATLGKQGVKNARVLARGPNKVAYQFRRVEAADAAKLERIAAGFSAQKRRACP